MKFKSLALALLLSCVALGSQAGSYTYQTDAALNSVNGTGVSGADATTGPVMVAAGQLFHVSTDANQFWDGGQPGDPNYWGLHTNADGGPFGPYSLPGLDNVYIGALVAEIDGQFAFVGAGEHDFAAWGTGALKLFYFDINNFDNSGVMISEVTVVPEPASLALIGLALGCLGFARQRRH